MTRFAYTAIPLAGGASHPRAPAPQAPSPSSGGVISGRMEAADEAALRDKLRALGLLPIDVRPLSPVDAIRSLSRRGGVRSVDGAWFFQTLRRLLGGKSPVESALATMEQLAPNPRMTRVCADVRSSLRGGASLANAVEQIPGLASPQHLALLRVGHESGRLFHVVQLVEQSLSTRERVRKAVSARLIYPVILLVVALVAMWVLSVLVIPTFAGALASAGVELPLSTRITLSISRWLPWALPPAIILLGLLIASRAISLPDAWRVRLDRWSLGWPLIGPLRWHGQARIVADTLATIVEGGGDVLVGFEQAEQALSSPVLRDRLAQARRDTREGVDLGESLDRNQVMPPMPGAIVRIGMKTGDLVDALKQAALLCEERQTEITDRLLTLMGPGIILVMAAGVGWVVYSLIAGVMTMNELGTL